MRSERNLMLLAGLSILLLCAGAILSRGVVILKEDERGVVISAIEPEGYRKTIMPPGAHWVTPFLESVRIYSIAPSTLELSETAPEPDPIAARTIDGWEVTLGVVVIYSIDPNRVVELHLNWQHRYEDELIRPSIREIARDVLSRYSAVDLSLKRFEIELDVSGQLGRILAGNSLVLQQFSITSAR
jgi:regulator of protease activity HflC (stomatin/prohibitin superfamily)